MIDSTIKFKTDEVTMIRALSICDKLGIDLSTYISMCVSRLIQENGIPFSMKINDENENKAILAMRRANRIAEENGTADMSLEEINAEIAEVRKKNK